MATPNDEISIIGKTLGFLCSAIKSGEPWSEQCETMKANAFAALDAIAEREESRTTLTGEDKNAK